MKHSHKLAVFISHIYGDFQNELCQGIIEKAQEYGYTLDFYVSNDETVIGDYGLGEKEIFQIPDIHAYEGILMSSGTYLVPEIRDELFQLLEEATCPILEINNSQSPFPNIGLDNISMIQDLVTHLHLGHNLSNLYYLGSSIHTHISKLRETAYIKGMEEHHLHYDQNEIYHCDYTSESVNQALDSLLSKTDDTRRPEGIVCYNDDLAFIVMAELCKRGYSVPEDIAVTGCDNLSYGHQISPPLTTISFPAREQGIMAFDTLLALIDKQEVAFPIRVKAQPILKGSCGCPYHDQAPSILFTNKLNSKIQSLESQMLKSIHMSGSLQNLDTIEEVVDYLECSLKNYPEIADFYFFLYSDWHETDGNVLELLSTDTIYRPNTISLQLGISQGKRLADYTFMNKQAVDDFLSNLDSSLRLFVPLYFEKKSFGFLCFTYSSNQIYYPFTFTTWLQNLNITLKDLSDQQNMRLLKEYLQDLNYRDDLTGLYNRQGFQYYSFRKLEGLSNIATPVSLVNLEIPNFLILNSELGLEESNFILKTFAKAIQKSAGPDAVCARYRGATFQIITTITTEEDIRDFQRGIQTYLANYQVLYNKDYTIQVSCAHVLLQGYCEDSLYQALLHIHESKKTFLE